MAFHIEKYRFSTETILSDLPEREYALLKKNMSRIHVKKGGIVYNEDNHSKGMYIVEKGKVKISQFNKDGAEQIVYIYKRDEILGYRPLLCNNVHPVTATALEDCIIAFISQHHFMQSLDKSYSFTKKMLVSLAYEFNVWINTMSVLSQQPVKERVALILLILNDKYKRAEANQSQTVISLSRQDMANYAQTTIETLARLLGKFKEQKIIRKEGRKIIILKLRELEKIADC